jgi:hypothetical protein
MTTQRRTDPAGIRYDEQQYELTRRLRLPGKLLLDRRIGEVERDVGQFAYADAWHEAGRGLLATWFELLRQARRLAQLQEQQSVATRSLDAIRRRVAAGDAPRVDAQLAEAEQGRLAARAHRAGRRLPGAGAAAADAAGAAAGADGQRPGTRAPHRRPQS